MSKINLGEPYNRGMKTYTCTYCNKAYQTPHTPRKGRPNYCSKSCSNFASPRRKLGTTKCKTCKVGIPSGYHYCKPCLDLRHPWKKATLAELKQQYSIHQYNAKIRGYSKTLIKDRPKVCVNCGYAHHVEVCHIKGISTFDLSATVGEVNDPSNLILLCPNCHWEFDNGLLKLEDMNC